MHSPISTVDDVSLQRNRQTGPENPTEEPLCFCFLLSCVPVKTFLNSWSARFVPWCEQAACQRAALMCSIMRVHLWDLTQFSRGKMETTRGALAASHCLMGRLKPVQTEIHSLPRRVGRWRGHRSGTALSTLSSDHIISDLGPSCSPPLCIFTLLSLPWAIKRISHHSLPVCFRVWLWRASSRQRITQNWYFFPPLMTKCFLYLTSVIRGNDVPLPEAAVAIFCLALAFWICVGFFFFFLWRRGHISYGPWDMTTAAFMSKKKINGRVVQCLCSGEGLSFL